MFECFCITLKESRWIFKGCLISEYLQFGPSMKKKCEITVGQRFHTHFFDDGTKLKISSMIKPTSTDMFKTNLRS